MPLIQLLYPRNPKRATLRGHVTSLRFILSLLGLLELMGVTFWAGFGFFIRVWCCGSSGLACTLGNLVRRK